MEELISPCVIHVLLEPKMDGLWRMCFYFRAINNIMVKILGRIFSRKGGGGGGDNENQIIKDPLQMTIRPITRARVKKLQEVFNGLVKEFIWVNPAFKEEPKSNQVIEGIGANKEVQKLMQELLQQTLGIQS